VTLAVVNLRSTAASGVVNFVFPRVQVGSPINSDAIDTEWGLIQGNYVYRDVSGRLGTQGSEEGIIAALDQQFHDRFTAFLTSSEYADLRATLSGQRGGSVGIAIEGRCMGAVVCATNATPTEVVIEDVLVNQPAARAGIRPGDVLMGVGSTRLNAPGADIAAELTRASQLIRGAPGTTVGITVQRGVQRITFTVRRANLAIPSVFAKRFGSVLYLQVTGFDNGAGDSARQMLREGIASGATSIILDLRQNGGGFVSEAQELASQFLSPRSGEQDVVVRRGRLSPGGAPSSAQSVVHDQIESGGVALTQPLVVLVDAGTASAAEIVTAALADYHRATVVGTKTFGKGSVQLDYPLPDGADLHLTVERWYGPGGESIDGAGISPSRVVTLSSPDTRFRLDAISPAATQDSQLREALAALNA
jgi:carboxyl-terminal processing protease